MYGMQGELELVENSWGGRAFLLLYVLAPEKFVAMALFGAGGLSNNCFYIVAFLLWTIMDVLSFASFLYAWMGAKVLLFAVVLWNVVI